MPYKERFIRLLDQAGVAVGGNAPADLIVHNDGVYARTLIHGSVGLGEAYMEGWWDCRHLDEFFFRVLSAELDRQVRSRSWLAESIKARLFNPQMYRPYEIGQRHYDLGNDLFMLMLDRRLIYSCGYWKGAQTLDEAQEAKLDLVFRKLGLEPGMRVLDIGCGWGGAALYAAEKCGVDVVGVTVSAEQVEYARHRAAGHAVDIRLMDYHDLSGSFDRIYSIGMFEHVGYKNYRAFFEKVRSLLAPDGLFLLHTIGGNHSVAQTDAWIAKYIFPNSLIPSARQISEAVEGVFVIEDWHNFGADYDLTLMHWHRNIRARRENIVASYGLPFYRMWEYYLLSCAGAFRARKNQLWQVVLSPHGVPGGYVSIR